MLKILASLRFRLTLLAVLLAGAVQALVGVVGLSMEQRSIYGIVDRGLTTRVATLRQMIDATPRNAGDAGLEDLAHDLSQSPIWRGYFVQLERELDQPLISSPGLVDAVLPTPRALGRAETGGIVFSTIDERATAGILGERMPMRMASTRAPGADGSPLVIKVATDMQAIEDSTAFSRVFTIASIIGGMLAACVATLVVLRRTFAPLESLSSLAHSVTPQSLDQRIDVGARHGEIAEAAAAMNELLERLGEAFKAQERFIADISHELKTPVSVLLTEAQVIRRSDPSPEQCERFMESVEEEMFRLGKLVESFLTLARAGSGQLHTRQTVVPFVDMAMEAVSHCATLARQSGVRLSPSVTLPDDDSIEPYVLGDPDLVRTMIENLIRNAIKFSPAEAPIDIAVEVDESSAHVRVRDRGPGVPDEYLTRLFTRFTQAHTGGGKRRGVGLGLAIVKGVADLHKGEVGVRNMPDGGCEFHVRLPLMGKGIGGDN